MAPVQSESNVQSADNQKGIRILTLDGGGIKGLVELKVLLEIERRTGRKINELFDLVCGTSTGGTIALITGLNLQGCAKIKSPSPDPAHYKQQVEEELSRPLPERIADLYKELAHNIFQPLIDNKWYVFATTQARYWISYCAKIYFQYGYGGSLYDTGTLADMSAEYLQPEFGFVSNDQLLGIADKYPQNKMTNVCVVSAIKVGDQAFKPYIFRSYKLPRLPPPLTGIESAYPHGLEDTWGVSSYNNDFYLASGSDGQINCAAKIWEAARATSAAPGVFAPIVLKHQGVFVDELCNRREVDKIAFIDGGIVANNPSEIALDEAFKLFDGRPIDCLVSLGTGAKGWSTEQRVFALRNGTDSAKLDLPQWMFTLDEMVTNAEYAHHRVRNRIALANEQYRTYQHRQQNGAQEVGDEGVVQKDPLAETTYFRFNPQCLKEDYAMTEWHPEKLKQMEQSAEYYLKTDTIQKQIDVLCAILTEKKGWQEKARAFRKRPVDTLLPAECHIQ